MSEQLDVTAANGVPFHVIADQRPRFGEPADSAPVWYVTFYDARYAGPRFTEHGQFASDYYADTLLIDRERLARGLTLHGGEPEWTIDGATMAEVLEWLASATDEPRDYAAEDLAQREADEAAIDGEAAGFMCDACNDTTPHDIGMCGFTDRDALDQLAAFVNSGEHASAADTCSRLYEILSATGRQVL